MIGITSFSEVPFEKILADSKDGEWGLGDQAVAHTQCWMIRGTDFPHLSNPATELPTRWIADRAIAKKQLKPGDIIFEMAGGTAKQSTGRSAFVGTRFFAKHAKHPVLCASFCRHLRLKPEFCSNFIYYLLQALYAAGYMSVFNIQHTGVSRFQYTSFKKQTALKLPPLDTQKKIAAILSAYDELIENNRQRIALLEKLAEEIYREWFVRLRFPGHDTTRIIKGVPQSWERTNLLEIADVTYGFAFDGSRFNSQGNGKPIIRIRNIPESSTTDYTEEVANEKYVVRQGDLLVGMDGEFHINHWHGDEAYLVQRVCRLTARDPLLRGYLAHAIRGPIKHFESILMGATVGHLGAMHLKSISILVPPEPLRKRLQVLNDILSQKLLLAQSTRKLTQTRDLLLPRLISGKLSVENLDIQFPPGMAEEATAAS